MTVIGVKCIIHLSVMFYYKWPVEVHNSLLWKVIIFHRNFFFLFYSIYLFLFCTCMSTFLFGFCRPPVTTTAPGFPRTLSAVASCSMCSDTVLNALCSADLRRLQPDPRNTRRGDTLMCNFWAPIWMTKRPTNWVTLHVLNKYTLAW